MGKYFKENKKLQEVDLEWDRSVPGFGVRHNRDGSQVFIAKLSVNGRQKWYTIGPTDLVKPEDARTLVRQMKLFAISGEDPRSLLKSFLQTGGLTAEAGVTFGKFAEIYIEQYAKIHKRSWLKDKQRVELYLMPIWANKRLSEIKMFDLLKIHNTLGKTKPYAANRLTETVSVMFKQAIVLGYLPQGHPSPAYGIRYHKEKSRRDKVSKSALPRLRDALDAYPKVYYRQAFYLLLMCCLRHGEVVKLRWDYFDFENMVLVIPVTKNGQPHILPITTSMKRLLDNIRKVEGCPWVFPSPHNPDGHIKSLTKAWQKIRKQAGIEHIRIHDLRRTAGCDILALTGSLKMVGDMLNHTHQHVTEVYGFYDLEEMTPVMETYTKNVAKSLGLESA